jgi:hypothetical protein
MPRIVIVILIYHRHKSVDLKDRQNFLAVQFMLVSCFSYLTATKVEIAFSTETSEYFRRATCLRAKSLLSCRSACTCPDVILMMGVALRYSVQLCNSSKQYE